MKNNKFAWEFITIGNKTYQFKNGKLKWIIRW
jgi:hypothetical protein